jgi:exopolysaccharide biosynthesis polyprenyl glycosylphosphotransferase
VGTNTEGLALAEQLANWHTSGLDLLGFVGAGMPSEQGAVSGLPQLGGLDMLPDLVAHYDVEELIVATSALTAEQLVDVFRCYGTDDGVNLRLSSGLYEIISTGLSVNSLAYVPLITVSKLRLSDIEVFMKNCLDYGGAAILLLLLSPVLALIALAVKLGSPGPIFYRRKVLGRGGVPFDAFKFRTMYVDGHDLLTAEQWANLQAYHKLKDDPRVTRVGRFLRKYSLDELPQLFNVLRGQMSLVGPRMISPAEKDRYGKWDMNLLTVKPGMSGLWVVSGRSDIPYEERVRLDMYYIRNYTIWLDLHILFRTLPAVSKGRGAY